MLRMLRYRIDRPSSRSFLVHSLYISDTQGKTWWEGSSSPSLCPADHSAGILHSRFRLTATWAWTEPWLDLGGQWPPLIFKKNIIKYMGTNFSNFVLENYTFVPLKISLILLRALL